MVRADQGIAGRATPRSKNRSTLSKPTASAKPVEQISKAAKRAAKRAELVQNVASGPKPRVLQLENGAPKNLSKSALKRLKKKNKEQLAGNKQGLKDLEDAMHEMQDQHEPLEDEDDEEVDEAIDTQHDRIGASKGSGQGVITAKKKRNYLTNEMARQPHILADPAFAKNPFAALRLHAQNTLAFDRGSEKRTGAKKSDPSAEDVDMAL